MHGITRVSDLLNAQGDDWDHAKIDDMFSTDDACDIKQIPVGGQGVEDFLAWNFSKDGVFTVRSAYHLLMSLRKARTGWPEPSSSVNSHRSWLALWGTHVPNKVKVHA